MKTALVTGATRGLGRALALDLVSRGYRVFGTGLNPQRLADLDTHAGIDAVRSDIGSSEANAALAERVGPVDLVVHNAGILGPRTRLDAYPRGEFDRVMTANATGPFDLTARLTLRPGATLIFLSSGVGNQTRAEWGAYCVSKHALEAIAGIYAKELTAQRVYVVDPGGMRTEMRASAYPDEDPMTLVTPEQNLGVFRHLLDAQPPTGGRFVARDYR